MGSKDETTTTKESGTEIGAEVTGQRTPLALVQPLPPANTTGYIAFQAPVMNDERKAFLKKQFCTPGCSDIDFEYFLAFCQRTGLDPVLKQAYLVERSAQVNGQWVTRYEPMASVAGMAARADALPDYRGMLGGAVYAGDIIKIDNATQQVTHVTEPLKRGALIGAWAHIQREGRRVIPTYFLIAERIQLKRDGKPTRFWEKMTAGQLLKCCEAEQYRKGYGNLFGGVYIPEEWDDEAGEVINHETQNAAPDTRSTTDKLADRAKTEKAANASRPGAESVPPGQRTVDVVVEKQNPPGQAGVKSTAGASAAATGTAQAVTAAPEGARERAKEAQLNAEADAQAKIANDPGSIANEAAPGTKVTAAVDQGPMMIYGTKKNQPIASLTGPELLENIILGESKVSGLTPDKAAKVRVCIDAIKAEQKKREAKLLDETPREPGSDDDID